MTPALNGTDVPAAEGEADGGDRSESRRFKPSDRLLDSRDFTRVLRRGRRRSSPELVVVTTQSRSDDQGGIRGGSAGSERSRLGITVGRKAGPSVKRNLFKRRVREWFRHHREELRGSLDVVIIARRPGIDLSLADLGLRLSTLLDVDRGRHPDPQPGRPPVHQPDRQPSERSQDSRFK